MIQNHETKTQKNGKAIDLLASIQHLSFKKSASSAAQNSIFNQTKIVNLKPVDLEKVQLALAQIDVAKTSIMSALAALNGFDDINKRDLWLAANMVNGYDYMLQEFLHQSRGGLKHENFNLGLVAKNG